MTAPSSAGGTCFCGEIRFSTELPSKWCAHCHCSMCRKIHGAGYVTWVGVEDDGFRLDRDRGLKWYRSSADSERGFCTECGTTLFFRSQRWPGEVHIALAAFDQPIDRRPQANAYYDTHVDWMPVDETLNRV